MTIKIIQADAHLLDWETDFRALGEGKANRVLSDALNKAGNAGRTQVRRAIVKSSGLPFRYVKDRTATIPSTPGSLRYIIKVDGAETNLNLFKARQLRPGVNARPWGHSRMFLGTFLVGKYGRKVFRRTGEERFPIEQLWGPNIAREALKGEPMAAFSTIPERLAPQIESQLKRYLP